MIKSSLRKASAIITVLFNDDGKLRSITGNWIYNTDLIVGDTVIPTALIESIVSQGSVIYTRVEKLNPSPVPLSLAAPYDNVDDALSAIKDVLALGKVALVTVQRNDNTAEYTEVIEVEGVRLSRLRIVLESATGDTSYTVNEILKVEEGGRSKWGPSIVSLSSFLLNDGPYTVDAANQVVVVEAMIVGRDVILLNEGKRIRSIRIDSILSITAGSKKWLNPITTNVTKAAEVINITQPILPSLLPYGIPDANYYTVILLDNTKLEGKLVREASKYLLYSSYVTYVISQEDIKLILAHKDNKVIQLSTIINKTLSDKVLPIQQGAGKLFTDKGSIQFLWLYRQGLYLYVVNAVSVFIVPVTCVISIQYV